MLAGLLAKGRLTRLTESLDALICRLAAPDTVCGRTDSMSLAAVALRGEGRTEPSGVVEGGWILYADPAHLQLQRDCFTLSSPVPLSLDIEETTALIDALNRHFAGDGLRFVAGGSGHWYLQAANPPAMATSHPGLALRRDVHAYQPQGVDAVHWRKLGNEIQMLLHTHPVNQRREERGLPACNSLWFWGGEPLQTAGDGPVNAYGESPLIRGLAQLGYVAHREGMPAKTDLQDGRPLLWWLSEVDRIDDGLELAAGLLRQCRGRRLRIHIAAEGGALVAELCRADLLRFWRRRRDVCDSLQERE
ncbi:MAG TPA: hypothetical protein VIK69_07975 [Methylophilaceae bacterium]